MPQVFLNICHGCADCAAAGSVGFTRRAGATRYTHGSIAELLQKYPAAIAALDPALHASQQQQQDSLPIGERALAAAINRRCWSRTCHNHLQPHVSEHHKLFATPRIAMCRLGPKTGRLLSLHSAIKHQLCCYQFVCYTLP
jgi:hypothetical protein